MGWEYYLLNFLLFVFGYITCKTFYFFNGSRIAVLMIKLSHVICLTILSKCIEAYSYATYTKLATLAKTGVLPNDKIYKDVKAKDEKELDIFKKTIIASIIAAHPKTFSSLVTFSDWNSAMNYLQQNRRLASLFLMEDKNFDK